VTQTVSLPSASFQNNTTSIPPFDRRDNSRLVERDLWLTPLADMAASFVSWEEPEPTPGSLPNFDAFVRLRVESG
jgi:hypothetical protein